MPRGRARTVPVGRSAAPPRPRLTARVRETVGPGLLASLRETVATVGRREEIACSSTATRCEVRGLACDDCVVTVLLGAPPEGVDLDAEERRALEVLAGSGLVPPLRLVPRRARGSEPRRPPE